MKPQNINLTAFGITTTVTRQHAASYLRTLRKAGCRLFRDRIRSHVGITAWLEDYNWMAVSYKVTN